MTSWLVCTRNEIFSTGYFRNISTISLLSDIRDGILLCIVRNPLGDLKYAVYLSISNWFRWWFLRW